LPPPNNTQEEEETYWRDFGYSIGNQQGDFVFRGTFQQNFFHGVVKESGLFTSSGGSINTLALTNEREIGNAGDTTIEQERKFELLPRVPSGVGINNQGDVVFSASAATEQNQSGIWLASGGSNPQPVLRAGHQIDPDTSIKGLGAPIINDAGYVILDASFEDDTRGIIRARRPRLFVWSGGAGTDTWHSFSGGSTNWKDVYEQLRSDNPGA
jgi:hypothetical protein